MCATLSLCWDQFHFWTVTQQLLFHQSAIWHLSIYRADRHHRGPFLITTISYALSCVRYLQNWKRVNARGKREVPDENGNRVKRNDSHGLAWSSVAWFRSVKGSSNHVPRCGSLISSEIFGDLKTSTIEKCSSWEEDAVWASHVVHSKVPHPCLHGPRSHVGTGKGHPQTVPTKPRGWTCPKCLGMLRHEEFHSLEPRGEPITWKTAPPPNVVTAKPRLVHRTARRWSTILLSRGNVSRAQSPVASHRSIQRFA